MTNSFLKTLTRYNFIIPKININLKGIAIGLSNTSKVILNRLKKTEFIDEIYIASSTYVKNNEDTLIPLIRPKEVFKEKWKDLDLIIFIGSIGASIRLINSFLTTKDKDPGVIVIDNKCSKIVPLIGLHQSNTQNIASVSYTHLTLPTTSFV